MKMDKIKKGIIMAVGSQLANIVSKSGMGTSAFDKLNMSYNLERFIDGATQVGALAGLTLATYSITDFAVKKAVPIASEKTVKIASLTSATSVAYALSQADIFREALYNMSAYNHQLQRAVETVATLGISAGVVAVGTLFTKDIYDYTSAKVKAALGKSK